MNNNKTFYELISKASKQYIDPNDFPLPASLMYSFNGEPKTTWDYLARDGAHRVLTMQNKQIEYGSKAMTFLIYNMSAPVNIVNPFMLFLNENGEWVYPTAAQVMAGHNTPDMNELNRWVPLLEPGKDPHVYLIPTLFCGDDSATTNNCSFHEFFLRYAVPWLELYSKAYIISTEASKSMTVIQMQNMIEYIKQFTSKPVGVHLQWDRQSNLPGNCDFLAYEFSYHPKDGNNYSVEFVLSEAQDVMAHSPMPVWFEEMDLLCETTLARTKSRTIRDRIPQCAGLPGPV